MKLTVVSYNDLINPENRYAHESLVNALLNVGIVGVSHVPEFEKKSRAFVEACVQFTSLPEAVKNSYAPDRDSGDTEGYELGAESFKDENNEWKVDDKKSSFYAVYPETTFNKWPHEVNLQTPYVELAKLIFETGKVLLTYLGLDQSVGLSHDKLTCRGRMLHYHKEGDITNANPDWCGAHYDHGVITGLMPAYYYSEGREVAEPDEAGLNIEPTSGGGFQKLDAADQSIMLFQVGEFGQLISDDRIRATKHIVKKAYHGIDRYAFALFLSADDACVIQSRSILAKDARYQDNQTADGRLSYGKWAEASFERYRITS